LCTHASRGMDEKLLIIHPKMDEIVSLTLTLCLTSLGGFSPLHF
jgi:hypothetical protein